MVFGQSFDELFPVHIVKCCANKYAGIRGEVTDTILEIMTVTVIESGRQAFSQF